MSDPADKSDDLIAELARLMATPAANTKPAVQPVASRTAPQIVPEPPAAPASIRIPGMDPAPIRTAAPAPAPVSPPVAASVAAPVAATPIENRAPATGTIRIPGMDQPAPVAPSAPVAKADPAPAAPVRAEPILSLSERIARQEAVQRSPQPVAPAPAPVRQPSALAPVSEGRAFGEGPAIAITRPSQAQPAGPPSDFHFDFGFADNPPLPSNAPQLRSTAAPDPIAALIAAEMASDPDVATPPQESGSSPTFARATPVQSGSARPAMTPLTAAPPKPAAAPIPLKPVSTAPRNQAGDRFMVAPGAGIEARAPEPPAPRSIQPAPVESDPMAEIESLIGEAVRVELRPEPARIQTPQMVSPKVHLEPESALEAEIRSKPEAPVVPPLTSGFAPRRARIKDDGKAAAEDAILAAVAASGGDAGNVEPTVGDDSPYRRLKVRPQKKSMLSGSMRQYVGMAVAGTLLLAAGLGLYWVLNMSRSGTTTGANAPQLTADTTPVKVKPAQTAKPETDAAKSPVLAKIDGASSAASTEQLVSTEDATAGAVTRDVTPTDADAEGGLANRKVRTVTVRPDGTIVSGDDAVAGAEALPVDRPNVPDVPSNDTTTLLDNGATAGATTQTTLPALSDTATAATPVANASEPITDAPVIDPTVVAPTPLNFPVRTASTKPLAAPEAPLGATAPKNTAVNAVVAQTPNGQIDLLGGDGGTQAAAQPAQAAPISNGGAAAYVQLSSQPTQGDAQASAKNATAKFGALFNGEKLVIQQADLGQKGVKWRVRLPAASLSQAQNICAQIKAQGGDCFATGG